MDKTPASIGLPMLVVVFMSICLFSFSGIAFSIARSSLKMSDEIEKRAESYQEACNEAEKYLAELEEIPAEETTYYVPFGVGMENLEVTIAPTNNGTDYKIIRWQVTETSSWEAPVTEAGSGDSGGGPQGPQEPQEGGPQGPQEGGPQDPQAPAE